jgi:FkbM family methyltransferase
MKQQLRRIRAYGPVKNAATSIMRTVGRLGGLDADFVRVGAIESQLPNGRKLRMWTQGDDWISNVVYWRGWSAYEPEVAPLFFRLASVSQVTIDVGAYVGFYALLAAHANPAASVYALEPVPKTHERLKRNVALNFLSNIECIAAAAGDVQMVGTLFVGSTELPTVSGLAAKFVKTWGEVHTLEVPVLMLDRFIRNHQIEKVDLVKVDTETTEPDVLRGMGQILRRDHPNIICEVHKDSGTEKSLEEVLRPLGYNFFLLTPRGPVQRPSIEGHAEWWNYLFTTLGPDELQRI